MGINPLPNEDGIYDTTRVFTEAFDRLNELDKIDILNTLSKINYDLIPDNNVQNISSCSFLPGVGFSPLTGVLDWKPDFSQSGPYEIKIIGTAAGFSDSKFFNIFTRISAKIIYSKNFIVFFTTKL